MRVEELCYDAAKLIPGLTPTRKQVEAERQFMQSEKDGVEIDQGIFLANVLANPVTGTHLCHAMLRPKREALERMNEFASTGVIDFGPAKVERKGKTAIVTIQNARFLNAEDDDTLADTETAVDLAILDPASEICVLRGGVVEHPKYKGRNVFCSGINLTHIYMGKIPFLWYVTRDMGIVNKMLRGVAPTGRSPDEIIGGTLEKPWVAQLEVFAIGGGCQYLLVMDYVVAGSDAYMTLAGAQGRHHPRRRQYALSALRRPAHRAAGDHDGQAARLRLSRRPHGLRPRRAAGRGGRGDR